MPDLTLLTSLWNDNKGAVDWSHNCANKKMRHLNIRNMAVRDAHPCSEIIISHLPGNLNVADLFTKEHKDHDHFLCLCNFIVLSRGNFPTSGGGVLVPHTGYYSTVGTRTYISMFLPVVGDPYL
jgi:hypothetical protein